MQLLLIIISPFSACFGFLLKILIENYSEKIKKEKKEKLDIIEYKLKEFYYPIYINLLRENSIWNKIISIYSDKKKDNLNKNNSISSMDSLLSPSKMKSAIPNSIFYKTLSEESLKITTNILNETSIELIKIDNTNPILINESDEEKNKIMLELDKEVLAIHLINQKIIHEHVIKVNPNEIIMRLLLIYDEHVTVYHILRKMNPSINNFKELKFPSKFKVEYPYELKEKIEEELFRLKNKQNKLCKFIPNNLCKI